MVPLIPMHTHFTRPPLLSFPATPFQILVLNPTKRLYFVRKSAVSDNLEMVSLKFLELGQRKKDEHSNSVCCGKGSESEGDMELEAEILGFMEKSENPNAFPTRKELEKAGRVDLVEAIKNRGGWYSFGWDSEPEPESEVEEINFDIEELQKRVENYQENDSLLGNEENPSASSSGESIETAVYEGSGIEGILNRLEKERISSLGIGKGKYGYGANHSSRDSMDNRNYGTTTTDRTDLGKNGSFTTGSSIKGNLSDSEVQLNYKYTPDTWREWIAQRAGTQGAEFEAGEVGFDKGPNEGRTESARDDVFSDIENHAEAFGRWKNNNHIGIRTRLQHLELELSSTLHTLRSKGQELSSNEVVGRSPNDLQMLSDAREFQENEVIDAQKRLRSIRAKLAILEGKIALASIDAQKMLEAKQKRIDSASKALQLLRTTKIVWHNPASEVLLTGSFDGWTTQRKMEKSHNGIFSVVLKLYPGRYEIKFIVDGMWKVDPLRPLVRNNGHENNLLIVT